MLLCVVFLPYYVTKILIETDTCVGKCSTFCEDSTDQIRSALQGRLYMIVISCNDSVNDASSVSNKAIKARKCNNDSKFYD